MRVLISDNCSLWLSREGVLAARSLGAAWASPEHMPVLGEPDCWLEGRDREEWYSLHSGVPRHDSVLLAVYDLMGDKMTPEDFRVVVVELPDDITYSISSHCAEYVVEQHRVWSATTPKGELSESVWCFSKDSTFEEFERRYGRE